MTEQPAPFDTLPLVAHESVTFQRTNGTFHRSFDEAFAASSTALYHFRKPLFRQARWVRLGYNEIKSVELAEMRPPVLLIVGLLAVSLAVVAAVIANKPSNPLAWFVAALPLYFPYLAYKSARSRLKLTIHLSGGRYRISAPLDGYKDETLQDNAILREIHALISKANGNRDTNDA